MRVSAQPMSHSVVAVVLAGGQSRRFQFKDKAWLDINAEPLVQHQLNRLKRQLSAVCVNTNRQFDRYATLGVPIIHDIYFANKGPLSGLYNGLHWAKKHDFEWVFTLPVDTVGWAETLPQQMIETVEQNAQSLAVTARFTAGVQNALGLWSIELLPLLEQRLMQEALKMSDWLKAINAEVVSDLDSQVININDPDDWQQACRLLR